MCDPKAPPMSSCSSDINGVLWDSCVCSGAGCWESSVPMRLEIAADVCAQAASCSQKIFAKSEAKKKNLEELARGLEHLATLLKEKEQIEQEQKEKKEKEGSEKEVEWGECIKRWNEHEARKKKRCHATAATERTTTDHAKTRTTDADAITNTNAAQDIPRTQLLSLTTHHLIGMME